MGDSRMDYISDFKGEDNVFSDIRTEDFKQEISETPSVTSTEDIVEDSYCGKNIQTICEHVDSEKHGSVRRSHGKPGFNVSDIEGDRGPPGLVDGIHSVESIGESPFGIHAHTAAFYVEEDEQKLSRESPSHRSGYLKKSASEPVLNKHKQMPETTQPITLTQIPNTKNAVIARNMTRRRTQTFAEVVRCLLKVPIQEDTHPYGIGHLYRTALDGKSPRIQRDESKYLMWVIATAIIVGIAVGVILMSKMYSAKPTKISAFNGTITWNR